MSRTVVGTVAQEPGSPAALLLEVMENGDPNKPIVLFITTVDTPAVEERPLIEQLRTAGALVYDIRCPISTNYTFAAARDDIFAAHVWLARSENIFDRSRMVFFGASMCGNLAVEASIATGSPAIAWSAPLDLLDFCRHLDASLGSRRVDSETRAASITRDSLRAQIATFASTPSMREEASPILRVHAGCGPIYLANSLAEVVPARQPLRMQTTLTNAGVASTLQLLSGSRHGYDYLDAAIEPTVDFIRTALRNEPASTGDGYGTSADSNVSIASEQYQ